MFIEIRPIMYTGLLINTDEPICNKNRKVFNSGDHQQCGQCGQS